MKMPKRTPDENGIYAPEGFEEACRKVAYKVASTVISKQHDYGHDNIMAFKEHGLVVRLSDKVARLKNLLWSNSSPNNESIEDTFTDIAGYAKIALMLANDTFLYELKETAYVTKKEISNGKS